MESVKRFSVGFSNHSTAEAVFADDFDRVTAENLALQQRLTVQDQREDDQKQRIASLVGKTTQCKACGSDDLFWYSHIHNHSTVQVNRLNTNDVTCLLILGCNNCSETLMTVKADRIAERMTAALKSTAEAEPQCLRCLDKKTVPGNIPGGFVKDCPDCCGEEG